MPLHLEPVKLSRSNFYSYCLWAHNFLFFPLFSQLLSPRARKSRFKKSKVFCTNIWNCYLIADQTELVCVCLCVCTHTTKFHFIWNKNHSLQFNCNKTSSADTFIKKNILNSPSLSCELHAPRLGRLRKGAARCTTSAIGTADHDYILPKRVHHSRILPEGFRPEGVSDQSTSLLFYSSSNLKIDPDDTL